MVCKAPFPLECSFQVAQTLDGCRERVAKKRPLHTLLLVQATQAMHCIHGSQLMVVYFSDGKLAYYV